MKTIKEVKEKANNKIKSLDKEGLKRKVKYVLVGGAIGAAGFVGYKVGGRVASLEIGAFVSKVLVDHPDVKDPFLNACNETIDSLKTK